MLRRIAQQQALAQKTAVVAPLRHAQLPRSLVPSQVCCRCFSSQPYSILDRNSNADTHFRIRQSDDVQRQVSDRQQTTSSARQQQPLILEYGPMTSSFKHIDTYQYTSDISIHRYRSLHSGLSVIHADIPGPICNAYITVSTQINDHTGCPHVLEHLCFLGSEKWPQKGLLDTLATRQLSQGTNAWTDVDHTAYTITTAGSEGLVNMMPVFLDHVFHPLLSDEAFHTEVHHVTGAGEDGGVVYCEMLSCQEEGSTKVYFEVMKHLFGDSCYSSNTGGRVECLRELTVETVRKYHASRYVPEHASVIVTGRIDRDKLLRVIGQYDTESLPANASKVHDGQPIIKEVVKPLDQSVTSTIEFPSSESESGSLVYVSWLACPWTDFLTRTALDVMWNYLTDTSTSPLTKYFVEENSMAGRVSYSQSETSVCQHYVTFTGVKDAATASKIQGELISLLGRIVEQPDSIDMERMKTILVKHKQRHWSEVEESPHDSISQSLINDFLYSSSVDSLKKYMDENGLIDSLATKDANWWKDLIKQYMLGRPFVCVVGLPSQRLSEEMQKQEKERVEKQKAVLGEAKLKELADELDRCHAVHEEQEEIADEILESFKPPSVETGIEFVKVASVVDGVDVQNGEKTEVATEVASQMELALRKRIAASPALPFYTQISNIDSQFVDITIYFDTSSLTPSLRLYLELYLEAQFELPLPGKTYDVVVRELQEQLIDHSNDLGTNGGNFKAGSYAQLLLVRAKIERGQQQYETAVKLLSDVLFTSQFDVERLKVSVTKLLSETSSTKRKPVTICRSAQKALHFDHQQSNHVQTNVCVQEEFLTKVQQLLASAETASQVVKDLEELRSMLFQPSNTKVHIVGNVLEGLQDVKGIWHSAFAPKLLSHGIATVKAAVPYSRSLLIDKKGISRVIPLASTDGAYLIRSVELGDLAFSSFEDRAALMTLIEYLSCLEGPMWRRIRGLGLSYNYSLMTSIEEGLLYLMLSESGQVVRAYREARDIVMAYAGQDSAVPEESSQLTEDSMDESQDDDAPMDEDGDGEHEQDNEEEAPLEHSFDDTNIENAKCAVIFDIISQEETSNMAADLAFVQRTLQGLGHAGVMSPSKQLLAAVDKVTKQDLERVLHKYLVKLFDDSLANTVIVVNPGKSEEVQRDFSALLQADAEDETTVHKVELIEKLEDMLKV